MNSDLFFGDLSSLERLKIAGLIFLGAFLLLALTEGFFFLRKKTSLSYERCRSSFRLSILTLAVFVSMHLLQGGFRELLIDLSRILFVLSLAFLAVNVVRVFEAIASNKHPVDVFDNRKARIARTKINLLEKTATVVIIAVAVLASLASFATARSFGASLIASAGLIGLVAGLAAQSTLGNMLAGLQLAFTASLRLDDVVVVEEEWGKVEEMHLTYIVIHLWDERSLVLPSRYFTENPFQNWTRDSSRVLGAVTFTVDYSVPVERVREELGKFLRTSPLWDKKDWVLQVTDVSSKGTELRALMSSVDAPTSWDLRCAAREHLLTFLVKEYPGAIFRTRVFLEKGNILKDSPTAPPSFDSSSDTGVNSSSDASISSDTSDGTGSRPGVT